MTQWHFGKDGQQHGPVSEAELLQLLKTGQLAPNTPIWKPGMETWSPANQVQGLGSTVYSSTPTPLPEPTPAAAPTATPQFKPPTTAARTARPTHHAPNDDDTAGSLARESPELSTSAHPWVRYFARMFDIFVFTVIVLFLVAVLYPPALELPQLMFNALVIAVCALAEAAMLPSWGTTPGKALLGVIVRDRHRRKLTFEQALTRSFKVAVKGLGLAIPVVSLVTHITAYNRLTRSGVTSWDEEGNLEVQHLPVSSTRWVVFVLVTLALFSLVVWAVALNEDYLDKLLG